MYLLCRGFSMPKKKRDRAYWLKRLHKDRPDIAERYERGEFETVRAACIDAELIKPRTRLMELKNAWEKASASERKAFVAWAKERLKPAPAPTAFLGPDGRLTEPAIAWIDKKMVEKGLKLGELMRKTGRNPYNASLGNALRTGTRPDPEMVDDVKEELSR